METLLKVENLNKTYDDKAVLKDICFELMAGETLAVIGHNGAGKSTLLNCISKVIPIDSGVVDWSMDLNALYKSIGVHRQMNFFEANARVKDVLRLYMSITGVKMAQDSYLKPYGLEAHLESEVNQLSFGEKQKLTLALALLHAPKILILDEMTTGVDLVSKHALWKIIDQLRKRQSVTIILVTHDLNEVAQYSDRVMILKSGEIQAIKTVKNLVNLEQMYLNIHKA